MTATAKITIGEINHRGHVGVRADCPECPYVAYTAGDPSLDWSHLIDDHLSQHEPGRAVDIAVDWEPSASCSVCEDGGNIHQEDDGLTCRDCGTTWSIDGTYGERAESC